jgi:hypothetical protein
VLAGYLSDRKTGRAVTHVYKTKITPQRGYGWRVWLWEPANGVQKFRFWAMVGDRKTKKEAEALADESMRRADNST